jgi:hypothetical protein
LMIAIAIAIVIMVRNKLEIFKKQTLLF